MPKVVYLAVIVAVLAAGALLLWPRPVVYEETSGPTETIVLTGTGTLNTEEKIPGYPKWNVQPDGSQPDIELGVIDEKTGITTVLFTEGDSIPTTVSLGDLRSKYRGKRVSIVARVEAMTDEGEVLAVLRTTQMSIFLHADGLQAQ